MEVRFQAAFLLSSLLRCVLASLDVNYSFLNQCKNYYLVSVETCSDGNEIKINWQM